MIRFLIKNSFRHSNGASGEEYITIDNDVVKLESFLTSSGYDEDVFDRYELIGAEVIRESRNENR